MIFFVRLAFRRRGVAAPAQC